jgi:amino acid adenylation domain-containing protein
MLDQARCIDLCVHELFAGHALATPGRVAVTCDGTDVTYGELDARAGRLAGRLLAAGVRRDEAVGVLLERSVDFVVAVLGILKAGGCYVPLDPDYPAARLTAMIEVAGARTLLSHRPLDGYDGTVLDVADRPGPAAPAAHVHPDDVAYLMFTSGSTGTPKGVAVRHAGIVRLVDDPDYVHLGPDEVIAQLSTVSFDASTFEIWGALANGGRLVIAPPGTLSPAELAGLLHRERVSTAWLTAGLFNVMVDECLTGLLGLRQLLTGGDVMSPQRARRFLRQAPDCRLINGYGPTEVTTFTTCHTVTLNDTGQPRIPIGRPISGTHVEILDDRYRPVPVGVPGFLYAGGLGVSRGYLGDPALTAERFVPDPWAYGQRLYATGDLATYRPDGTIDFLGRADHQFKKRGFRVEPVEIEDALRRDPLVKDAAVTLAGSGADDTTLIAYVVPAGTGTDALTGLRRRLAGHLPEHLLPDRFAAVGALPLTPNGKVDRRALAGLAAATGAPSGTPTGPHTTTEATLAEIWTELLAHDGLTRDDDFFDLGGQSLQAARMVSRIRTRFGVDLTVRTVFDHPTVAELAHQIDERTAPATH